uniref:Bridge-like lipid transfer protein family member 1 C-terminal domain-containing protein n=1 Tax=Timema bartmani TaxID=61472 RepID=A0A7R9F2D7_9NEOP|nr:unnamed protein product [Timema bartmani]
MKDTPVVNQRKLDKPLAIGVAKSKVFLEAKKIGLGDVYAQIQLNGGEQEEFRGFEELSFKEPGQEDEEYSRRRVRKVPEYLGDFVVGKLKKGSRAGKVKESEDLTSLVVRWLTKDFKSEGRLSIGSTGHKNMYIGVALGGSSLDAKGGIVGGTIELSKIDTFIHIHEDPGTEPDHTVGLKLFALEFRLDYMGTGVLMSRVSALSVSLRDEWKINCVKKTLDSFIPTRRPAMIFMHGDLGWDQLQLMISKSTTADLLKMFYKLDEFFSQQFKSSKRVFSSLQPRTHPRASFGKKQTRTRKKNSESRSGRAWASSVLQDARHHRHWQRVLAQVAGLHLSTLSFPLPTSGTVLGGTMELHGNNISLACFHGINFKSKSWALFSLKEPCISFATEAQEIPSTEANEQLDVHVVQTLTFSLGMMADHPHAQHHSMATVCRLSRNVLFPPQFRTLQEWFHYAFANSEIDAVDRFPSLERERSESCDQQRSRSNTSNKLQDPNHTREVIFALPSLQLHLKTEHLQAAKTPDVVGKSTEVSLLETLMERIYGEIAMTQIKTEVAIQDLKTTDKSACERIGRTLAKILEGQ